MSRRILGIVVVSFVMLLAACGDDEKDQTPAGGYHVEVGAAETQLAQTATAFANPTITPGPSPTPTMTSTPYTRPSLEPSVDSDTVITRVGDEEITLDEFQQRVRFERWYRLYQIDKLVRKHGFGILDLTKADNQTTASTFVTLADSLSFGNQVHRVMVVEAVASEEAKRRAMEVDPIQFEAKAAEYMLIVPGENGVLPAEYEGEYAEFVRQMEIYTGMSDETFRRIVRNQVYYEQLKFLKYQEPEAVAGAETQAGIEVQDILLDSEAQAAEVVQRLQAGEALAAIATALGKTPAEDASTSRILRREDPNLPEDVLVAVFSAKPGEIVGPFELANGWYVAQIIGEKLETVSPSELDELKEQYFLNWVEAQMDDPKLVTDYDNWFEYIPEDPLPMDVSPLLHDENFILPAGEDYIEDVPTAEPTAEATEDVTEDVTEEVTEEATSESSSSLMLVSYSPRQDATPTPTPYAIPTNGPDFEADLPITRVGEETITLDAFQKRVRFERWFRLYQVDYLVDKYGPEQVLDLTNPDNAFVLDLFNTLTDATNFGRQVQRIMVVEALTRQETAAREIELDTVFFESKLANYLILQLGTDGARPAEFEERYAEFVAQMQLYTGMSEAEFRDLVAAQTLYSQLGFEIKQDPAALPDSQGIATGVYVQDILVETEDQANEIITRLAAGENLLEIAADLGYNSTSGESRRLLKQDDETVPETIREAVFAASAGGIIGPLETEQGWYVALVGEPQLDILTPTEVEALQKAYFNDWMESRMDDPELVEDYANWEPFIPQEPLPMHVSPYFTDNYVIMPEAGEIPQRATATPSAS